MDTDDGLQYALQCGFTPQHYEKAAILSHDPKDKNQLLQSLLKVRLETSLSQSSTGTVNTSTTISSDSSVDRSVSSSAWSVVSLPEISAPQLRPIYIDGSNIAMEHGNNKQFSWKGIKICVDWFLARGHKVKVFVPVHKCVCHTGQDSQILEHLSANGLLCKTPAGCNDDYYLIDAAQKNDGIIVSNDMFRKEQLEDIGIRQFLDKNRNRLPYTFLDDDFLPPRDPCGPYGPKLDQFLRVAARSKLERAQQSVPLMAYRKLSTTLPAGQAPIGRFNPNHSLPVGLLGTASSSSLCANCRSPCPSEAPTARPAKQKVCRTYASNATRPAGDGARHWRAPVTNAAIAAGRPLARTLTITDSGAGDERPRVTTHSPVGAAKSYHFGQNRQPAPARKQSQQV